MRAIVNRYINYNYLYFCWSRKKIIQQPQLILYTRDYGRANALTNWFSKFFLISIPPTINDEKWTVQESIGWKEYVVWKPKGRKIASIGQYLGGVGGSPTRDGTKWRRNGSYYTLFRLDIADSYRNHPDHDVSLYENSFRTPVFHEFIKIRWSTVATGDTPDVFFSFLLFVVIISGHTAETRREATSIMRSARADDRYTHNLWPRTSRISLRPPLAAAVPVLTIENGKIRVLPSY